MNRIVGAGILILFICYTNCVQAQPASSWQSAADSANAYLKAGDIQNAYRQGLKVATVDKPVSVSDSIWTVVLQISRQLPDSVEVSTLMKAGSYYLTQNSTDKADVHLAKAVQAGERLHLPVHYLQGYLLMARIKQRSGARDVAKQLYKRLLADSASQHYPFRRVEALLGLTDTYLTAYQFDSAGIVARKALGLVEQQPDFKKSILYPMTRMQLARWAYLSGNLTQSIQEIEESYSVAKATRPNDPALISIGYNYMQIISDINDEKALEATQTARRVLQQQPNYVKHPYYLLLLSSEIGMHRTLEHNDKSTLLADSVFRRHSLEELSQLYGFSSFLHQANRTYLDAHRNDELERIAKKTTELLAKQGQSTIDSSYFYSILGRYYQYKQDYSQAVHALREEMRLDATGKEVSYINHSLKNRLAICQARAGQRTAAFTSFEQLMQEFDQNARYNLWLMSDAERDNYLRTSTIHGLFLHLVGRPDPQPKEIGLAYDYKLLQQGVRLKISRTINQLMHSRPKADSSLDMVQQLIDVRSRLANRKLEVNLTAQRQLKQTADSLERLLGGNSALLINRSLKPVRWQNIRARLKSGEAAIELIWYDNYSMNAQMPDSNRYSALIVRPEWAYPKVVHLPVPAEELKKHTAEEVAYSRTADYYINYIYGAKNQRDVFEQFWQPIANVLGSTKRIYIALDGSYQHISLSTVRNPKTGKFLIDELEIVVLNSTQDILESPRLATNLVAELVGHPTYSLVSQPANRQLVTQRGNRSVRMRNGLVFDDLPSTKTEVEQLGKLFKTYRLNPRVRLDTAASETAFQQMRSPKIVHVATHGYRQDTSRTAASQLLTCGLVLAGAADTVLYNNRTDGILTGYEASLLNLHGTELVALSACETGAGDHFEGEGVFGLQRAFLLAGAQSVLMSLWKINDQLTQQLMLDFYRNWLSGMSKPQALRKAQQKLRNKYPNPYYWGAFVLLGH